jgi:hypothetical protein
MNYHALPFEYIDLLIDRRNPRPQRLAGESVNRGRKLFKKASR